MSAKALSALTCLLALPGFWVAYELYSSGRESSASDEPWAAVAIFVAIITLVPVACAVFGLGLGNRSAAMVFAVIGLLVVLGLNIFFLLAWIG